MPSVNFSSVPVGNAWKHTVHWSTECHARCYYRYAVRNVKNSVVHAVVEIPMTVGVCADIIQQ